MSCGADDACNQRNLEAEKKSKVKARIYTELLYRHWNQWQGKRRSHLMVVPMGGGAVRVASLVSGAEVTRDNARFFDAPVPVLVHIFGAAVFALLGAFQFVPSLRRGGRRWHRD